MKQRVVGLILIAVGLVIAGLIFAVKLNEDRYISSIIHETGSCYLSDGTCLHEDRKMGVYIAGWTISGAVILFGAYLAFVDRTEEDLKRHQIKIASALENAKALEIEKDEKNAFISGFNPDEQKILKAVIEQDGIKQSTLRFKTNLSKTTLSLMLKSLEERGFISRKDSGKSKQVFFIKKF